MTQFSDFIHITSTGFSADPWQNRSVMSASVLMNEQELEGVADSVIKIEGTASVENLEPFLKKLTAISIDFPSSQDGRGFSLARKLRDLGYKGEMRAEGSLHVDQFRHALQAGFDAVAITHDQAERMPENEWQAAASNALPSYQARFHKK